MGQVLNTTEPTGFFTNLASQLLQSDLNLPLTRIQVYPTNQYTPAVHRVLQLTANLYDATTNRPITGYPFDPTVFRPLFRRDAANTEVFIAGFREVTNADIALPETAPPMVDLQDSDDRSAHIPVEGTAFQSDPEEPLVSGIPLVIGAKKGLPNFNQFGLENAVTVTRFLYFHRQPGQPVSQTNQAYTLSISNSFGLQAWNSYGNPFPRPVRVIVDAEVSLTLSNEFGIILGPDGGILSNRFTAEVITDIPARAWEGFSNLPTSVSLQVPLLTNSVFLKDSFYVSALNRFVASKATDPPNDFPVPRWWLSLETRVRFALVDIGPNRLLDYVNLADSAEPLNIMDVAQRISLSSFPGSSTDPDPGSLWQTNRWGNPSGSPEPDDPTLPTYGILQQFLVSAGLPEMVSDSFWKKYNAYVLDEQSGIDAFVQRLTANGTNLSELDFAAPFSPTRTFYQYVSWQANDPLVHYTVPDLVDLLGRVSGIQWDSDSRSPVTRLTNAPLSEHYRPWGGNPYNPAETPVPTRYNLALKDPLVKRSDDWQFPSGERLSLGMLGRVHRGTPWQTIYLKSAAVASNAWMLWTGDTNALDALASEPTNDWHLVSLLDRLLNSDSPDQRLSVNEPDPNAWLKTLEGLTVLTNSSTSLGGLVLSSNSPQAAVVADAIRRARSAWSSQYFPELGDILGTPEMSDGAPWLSPLLPSVTSEEACEKIPSQLLPLLRADSVGSVVLSNGQTTVQFSGYDGYPYAIESSSNLTHWSRVSTNYPGNGVFRFAPLSTADRLGPQFYQSLLLP